MQILTASLSEIAQAVRSRKVSAREVVLAHLAQIEKCNPRLNAFITINHAAEKQALELDERIAKGLEAGPLAGVPVAIKDQICTRGIKTTAASKMLHNFIPPYSATLVEKLEQAGAVIIGKTNQDEFAMGSSTETSAYGLARNPWNSDYVPGGSSGGSAVAVAGGMSPAAIGTDTGGSIRQPASFCGIVGIKPTYGRVSRYGVIAFASSLDQAGPMTRTVLDAAIVLENISGLDAKDSTSANQHVPAWSRSLNKSLKGLRVGLPKEYFATELGSETRKVIEGAIDILRLSGAELTEISLPLTQMAVPVYYLVATSEASSNLARYDGVRYGYRANFSEMPAEDLAEFYCRSRGEAFGVEVKRRIILGTYALSSGYYEDYYKKASQVRRLLRDQYVEAFKKCDVLLGPVTTTPAFKIGCKSTDPVEMYLNDIYTTSANLTGIPGISIPGGFAANGMPIGVQILGGHFQEQLLFNVGAVLEEALSLKEFPNVL